MRNIAGRLLEHSVGCGSACRTVEAPHFPLGDTWTYQTGKELRDVLRTSHVTTTVVRIDPRYLAVETHTAGMTAPGPDQLVGPDQTALPLAPHTA